MATITTVAGSVVNYINALNQNIVQIGASPYGSPTSYFQFPHDLSSVGDINLTLQFYEYERPSIFADPILNSQGSIVLPLPSDMLDRLRQNYSEIQNGMVIGGALEGATVLKDGGNNIAAAAALVGGVGAGAAMGALASLANTNRYVKAAMGVAVGSVGPTLQLAGMAQNPFLSVLFNSPSFKRHSFQWMFIPENETDSNNLKHITNKLRYHSMPDLTTNSAGLLLNYPDMVKPIISPSGFFYDFKYCVIESVEVNYAPGDTPGLFPGTKAPTGVRLTIHLLEIEYWLKQDVNKPTAFPNFAT